MLHAKTYFTLAAIILAAAPVARALDDCAQDSKKHSTFDSPRPRHRTHVHNQTDTPLKVRWRSRLEVHNPDGTTRRLTELDLDNTYDLSSAEGRAKFTEERHTVNSERRHDYNYRLWFSKPDGTGTVSCSYTIIERERTSQYIAGDCHNLDLSRVCPGCTMNCDRNWRSGRTDLIWGVRFEIKD